MSALFGELGGRHLGLALKLTTHQRAEQLAKALQQDFAVLAEREG